MKNRVFSSIGYLISAFLLFIGLCSMIVAEESEKNVWSNNLVQAFIYPQEQDLIVFALINIFLSLVMALVMFLAFDKSQGVNLLLVFISWLFLIVVWQLTSGLHQGYFWGAVCVTFAALKTFNKAKQAGTS